MSRAALSRQAGNVKERERVADELFDQAVEGGRNNRAKNLLPLWGPDDSFHLNRMLLQNIIHSSYFQKCCRELTDWNKIVDEIYYKVDHLEPFALGSKTEPSVAFCLLLRLLTLRCTAKQMQLLLEHADSPYIRAIGFLYLRYTGEPKQVWKWIKPYIHDDEPVDVLANPKAKHGAKTTIGEYVRSLFSVRDYYGTMLPRFPMEQEREIQVNLLHAEKIGERATKHANNPTALQTFRKVGAKVRALYGDDENPIRWYDAVVDKVLDRDPESGEALKQPKFVVTFPEYGNTETVTLGEMEMPGVNPDEPSRNSAEGGSDRRGRDRDFGRDDDQRDHMQRGRGGGYDRDRDRNRDYGRGGRDRHGRDSSDGDLYEEVKRRERESSTAGGRSHFSRHAPNQSRRNYHDRDDDGYDRHNRRNDSRGGHRNERNDERSRNSGRSNQSETRHEPPERKRTQEELAALATKKRKLMAKYG